MTRKKRKEERVEILLCCLPIKYTKKCHFEHENLRHKNTRSLNSKEKQWNNKRNSIVNMNR